MSELTKKDGKLIEKSTKREVLQVSPTIKREFNLVSRSGDIKEKFVVEIKSRKWNIDREEEMDVTELKQGDWLNDMIGVRFPFSDRDIASIIFYMIERRSTKKKKKKKKTYFTDPGWQQHEGVWIYVHNSGVIGTINPNWRAKLSRPASLIDFGQAPNAKNLKKAIKQLTLIRKVTADNKILSEFIFSVLPLSVMNPFIRNQAFFVLVGPTESRKTAYATAILSFMGKLFNETNFQAQGHSSPKAVIEIVTSFHGCLCLIDDITIKKGKRSKDLEEMLESVAQAASNNSVRQTLNSNRELAKHRDLASTILSTAERIVYDLDQSTHNRIIYVRLTKRDIDNTLLSQLQKLGKEGVLASITHGFIDHLTTNREETKKNLESMNEILAEQMADGSWSGVSARYRSHYIALVKAAAVFQSWIALILGWDADRLKKRMNIQRRYLSDLVTSQTIMIESESMGFTFLEALRHAVLAREVKILNTITKRSVVPSPNYSRWSKGSNQGTVVGYFNEKKNQLYIDYTYPIKQLSRFSPDGKPDLNIENQNFGTQLKGEGWLDTGKKDVNYRRRKDGKYFILKLDDEHNEQVY